MESKLDLLSREEKFQLLDQLVRNGIEELCKFAKQHKYLEPPYGKRPDPTPLISEEDFVKSGALQCDDREPEFRYEYGFDPVKFLGQYLVWAHPDSVETRRQKKEDALNRLRFRVAHARKQLQTEELLVERAKNFRSGIMWGPLALVVAPTAVRLSLRTFRPSTVLLQVAADVNFTDDVRMFRLESQTVVKTTNDNSENSKEDDQLRDEYNVFSCHVDLEQLRGRQVYHCRAIAFSKNELANGTINLPAQDADFWHSSTAETESANSTFHIAPTEALYSIFSTAPVETPDIPQTPVNTDNFDDNNNDNDHTKKAKRTPSRPTSRSASREIDEDTEAAAMREKVMTLRCLGQLPVENALFAPPPLPSTTLQHPLSLTSSASCADVSVNSTTNNNVQMTTSHGHNRDRERTPDFTAVLSDAFWHKDADYFSSHNLSVLSSSDYGKQLSSVLQRLFYTLSAGRPVSQDTSSNANNTSLLWAYRDAHPRAMAALRQEELAFKQHRHDLKKYNKKYDLDTAASSKSNSRSKTSSSSKNSAKDTKDVKDIPPPPQLKLPELSPQLEALLQQLPVPLSMVPPPAAPAKDEKNAKKPLMKKKGAVSEPVVAPEPSVPAPLAPRMLYRAVSLSADVLAIVLDLRRTPDQHSLQINSPGCDYLGREQTDWLTRILRKSTALWKVILCAKTFGACLVREEKLDVVETHGDGFFAGNELLENGGSRPGTTTSEVEGNNAASAAPVVGVLKRQPSTSGSQARFVQVMEPEKDESKLLDPVYDEVDDVFGRSKCSLQYVLARYQEKVAEEKAKEGTNATVLPPPLFSEVQQIGSDTVTVPQYYVSSGIVLVTGGTASAFTRTILSRINNDDTDNDNVVDLQVSPSVPSIASKNNNNNNNNNSNVSSSSSNFNNSKSNVNNNVLVSVQVSDVHDTPAPTFCASYDTLNKTQTSPLHNTVSLLTRTVSSTSLPGSRSACRDTNNNFNKDEATLPPHMLPFCFEVSVGHGAVQTEDGAVFRFLPGFDGRTLYLSDPQDTDVSQTDVSQTPSAPQCELSLLADGRLEIACVSSLPLDTSDATQNRLLPPAKTHFRCRLTVPNLDDEDDQASTQSADSIHVA